MAVLTNTYGSTGPYGSGTYKGSYFDNMPDSIPGIGVSDTRKCFHLGFNDDQGNGWDEVSGDAWVWPESQGAVLNVFDESGQIFLVVWDENDGLPYVLNTSDGPADTNMERVWLDKVDPNIADSGTHIEPEILFPEDTGENSNYEVEHQETTFIVRPIKASHRGADGYDDNGLLSDTVMDLTYYADGKIAAESTLDDIQTVCENMLITRAKGNSLQAGLTANCSAFKITDVINYYKVIDRAQFQNHEGSASVGYETELSALTFWLSRGASLLLDRVSLDMVAGTISGATGPDGKTVSAIDLTE